jgi:diphosphomevalonate decarboxylase
MPSHLVSYEAPSNIALVKYWGKHGLQYPKNASISFTLQTCTSIFQVKLVEKQKKELDISLLFEGVAHEKFVPKIASLFEKVAHLYPIINEYGFEIESKNTFPHSSGIASSASSMAALAMCLEDLQYGTTDIQRASSTARIGSGSASRSVIPKLGWWGAHPSQAQTSDEYATPVWEDVDPVFHTYQNAILIASAGEKAVSSSLGHSLMQNHLYASKRFEHASNTIVDMYGAMREGDIEHWGMLVEYEALSLHALMMLSQPSFILVKPNTLAMIERIKNFRNETKVPVYFTLDAGPNIHLLYPLEYSKAVLDFIKNELESLCENKVWIQDAVGDGPRKIK